MTTPYSEPPPNPGGEYRKAVRQALAGWVDAQKIPGIGQVLASLRPDVDWAEVLPSHGCAAVVHIYLGNSDEARGAYTGPVDPGGKDIHYEAELRLLHRGLDPDDWEGSEDDFDRIVDALMGALRGRGRDLGKPGLVLQAGEWGQGIQFLRGEPQVQTEEGDVVDRRGSVAFTISVYLPTFVPAAP